jgi:lipoyl(octanoyl) transferase
MGKCSVVDLGLIGFADAFALQKRIVAARKAEAMGDVLLLCEHPHVITLGRNGSREHLLASEPVLRQKGVEFHATNRGGDITYHGPGQIVGYPVINLGAIRRDVVWYVRMLEEVMIRTCGDFGVGAGRESGKTGVWVTGATETSKDLTQRAQSSQSGVAEKIGAIGVHISRWVTSHGFAFNVATDLRFFDLIVPCGIMGRTATSLEKVLGRRVDPNEVAPLVTKHFGEVFGLEMKLGSREGLMDALRRFESELVAIPA